MDVIPPVSRFPPPDVVPPTEPALASGHCNAPPIERSPALRGKSRPHRPRTSRGCALETPLIAERGRRHRAAQEGAPARWAVSARAEPVCSPRCFLASQPRVGGRGAGPREDVVSEVPAASETRRAPGREGKRLPFAVPPASSATQVPHELCACPSAVAPAPCRVPTPPPSSPTQGSAFPVRGSRDGTLAQSPKAPPRGRSRGRSRRVLGEQTPRGAPSVPAP